MEDRIENPADPISFGQLKKIVAQQRAKPKEPKCSYIYRELEDVPLELADWHEYHCEPRLSEAYQCFQRKHRSLWKSSSASEQAQLMTAALSSLTEHDLEIQFSQSSILFYLVNGCYAEVATIRQQKENIQRNCAKLSSLKPLNSLVDCMCTSWQALQHETSPQEEEQLEHILQNVCTILFFLLLVNHEESTIREGLANEMRCLQIPLVTTLVELLAQASDVQDDRSARSFVRQFALLLRQALLCSLGGSAELQQCKLYRRRTAQLPAEVDKGAISTTPLDYAVFRSELISKYPCYLPPPLRSEDEIHAGPLHEISQPLRQTFLDLPIYADGQWSATPAPSPPPSPKGKKSMYTTDQTVPFLLPLDSIAHGKVPSSIEEAAALFESRQRTSIPLMELWQEQEHFVKSERGWIPNDDNMEIPETKLDELSQARLVEVDRVYRTSLPHLQSGIIGLLSKLWSLSSHNLPSAGLSAEKDSEARVQDNLAITKTREWLFDTKTNAESKEAGAKSTAENESCRELEIILKGISGSLLWLLKWFRVSHVLKFEYLSQLLIDADWIPTMHQVMISLNPATNIHADHEDSRRSYFNVCSSLSEVMAYDSPVDDSDDDGEHALSGDLAMHLRRPGDEGSKEKEAPPEKTVNKNVFYDMINLLAITQKLVKKKTHRNSMLVQNKSWLHLRRPLRVNHDLTQLYCLKLYKGQVPLCSRKWRMSNMKIITQIYLSCRPELREDWIAGTDADTDLEEAKHQESAIRALILFYNTRQYPDQMRLLGFLPDDGSESEDDFFETEVSRLH